MSDSRIVQTSVGKTVDVEIEFPEEGDSDGFVRVEWNEHDTHFASFNRVFAADTGQEIGWQYRYRIYTTRFGVMEAIVNSIESAFCMHPLK